MVVSIRAIEQNLIQVAEIDPWCITSHKDGKLCYQITMESVKNVDKVALFLRGYGIKVQKHGETLTFQVDYYQLTDSTLDRLAGIG